MKTLETRKNKILVVIKTLSNVFNESRKENYFHFIIIFGEHNSKHNSKSNKKPDCISETCKKDWDRDKDTKVCMLSTKDLNVQCSARAYE